MTEVRLAIANVSRRFGDRVAVADVSIEVAAGEIYGLIGPDGAGKTTTLRIAAGLIAPDTGTVRVAGADSLESHTDALGYMPQQYSLYGDLTVAENLAFFREMYGLSRAAFRARRDRLLALTRLAGFRERRATALSGGMSKKLALACALLHEPEVLLLDEPTTGVDPVSRRELWDLLHEFLAEGMAIVLATPYMDEAARCHRAGMLDGGTTIAEGSPAELIARFPHPAFAIHGDREAIEHVLDNTTDVLAQTPAGERIRIVVRAGRERGVLAALASAGAEAVAVAPTFEDVFLARMQTG